MSLLVTLADAIAASLNAGEFSPSFTAERAYAPLLDLGKGEQGVRVFVVPKANDISLETRSTRQLDIDTDIGVLKRIEPGDTAGVDRLMGLVEQIADHLSFRDLGDAVDAQWIGVSNEPVFDPETLVKKHTFASVITTSHRVSR